MIRGSVSRSAPSCAWAAAARNPTANQTESFDEPSLLPSSIQSWIQDQGRAVIAHGHSAGDQDQAPQGLYLFDAALGHVSALLFGYRADIEPQVALTLPRFAEDRATSFIHLLCENPAENLDVPPCEVLRIVQNFKRGGSRRKAALSRYVLGLRENGRQAQDPRENNCACQFIAFHIDSIPSGLRTPQAPGFSKLSVALPTLPR